MTQIKDWDSWVSTLAVVFDQRLPNETIRYYYSTNDSFENKIKREKKVKA